MAGMGYSGEGWYVSGGRVMSVVGMGPDVATARTRAYEQVERIHYDGKWMRTDIAAGV